MEQLEKVRKGMECCDHPNDHEHCPYNGEKHYNICTHKLLKNAIALINAQQERIAALEAGQAARVMTLEEAQKDIEIWYESVNGACGYGDLCYDAKADLALYTPHGIKGVSEAAYNKTWRCWTQRPTDEQREAAKWDE